MRPLLAAVVALGGALGLAPSGWTDETPTFVVAGRATAADGTPLSGRIVATPTMPLAPAREAALDAEGRFAVDGLDRATVTVEHVGASGVTLRRDGIGLPHAAPLDLRMPSDLRTLAGTVRDAAGRTVGGATVRSWAVVGHGALVDATTTTAADGTYALRVHPEGWLRVEAVGFATSQRLVGRVRSPFGVRLARTPTVSGRVRRPDGTPIAGTSVWARPAPVEPGDPFAARPQAAALLGTTDADGAFGPWPLTRGRWSVFALGAGAVSREVAAAPTSVAGVAVDAFPGVDRVLDLVAVGAASLAGIVLDDAGHRVPDAEVVAGAPALGASANSRFPAFQPPDETVGPAATTDAQGRFSLEGLVPGRPVALVARRRGVAGPVRTGVVPTRERSAAVTLTVPVVRTLEVRIVDDAGHPVPEALVSARAGEGWRSGVTGDDGRVVLGDVPTGDVAVAVRPFGAVAATETTLAGPKDAPEATHARRPVHDVRVVRGGIIAGRLRTRDGPTPTGLVVSVLGPVQPRRARSEVGPSGAVRADGSFVVAGLEPGRYVVVGGTRGAGLPLEGRTDAETDVGDVEVVLEPVDDRGDPEPGTFEVRVVDPDGRPVPLASGTSQAEDAGTLPFDVEAGSAVLPARASDTRVRVRFALDADGRPLPLAPADVTVASKAGSTVTITLPPERTIVGRVVEPDGRPANNVEVRAQVPGPDPFTAFHAQDVASSVARTDAEGRFVLGQLGDRTYDVEVPSAHGVLAATLADVRAGTSEVVVRRRKATDLAVRVTDPQGRPVVGATLRWTALVPAPDGTRPAAPVLPWTYDPPERTTDAQGRVRVLGLDPDVRLRLEVRPPDERRDLRDATLEARPTDDVTIVLAGGLTIRGAVRDRDGQPVPWAGIRGHRGDDVAGFDEVDHEGRFVLDRLAAGPVDVTATLLGVRDAGRVDARATVMAGAQDVVLVVDPGPTLVVRAEGRTFPAVDDARRVGGGWTEARVIDEGPDGAATYGHVEGGALVFRRLRPGQPYTLWIPWTREAGGTYLETGASLAVGTRTVVLEAGAPIRGSVDRSRVRPRENWTSTGPAREAAFAVRGSVKVRGRMSDEGEIEFPPLPAGRWRVEAHLVDGAGTGRYEASADVDAGTTIELTPVPRLPR